MISVGPPFVPTDCQSKVPMDFPRMVYPESPFVARSASYTGVRVLTNGREGVRVLTKLAERAFSRTQPGCEC